MAPPDRPTWGQLLQLVVTCNLYLSVHGLMCLLKVDKGSVMLGGDGDPSGRGPGTRASRLQQPFKSFRDSWIAPKIVPGSKEVPGHNSQKSQTAVPKSQKTSGLPMMTSGIVPGIPESRTVLEALPRDLLNSWTGVVLISQLLLLLLLLLMSGSLLLLCKRAPASQQCGIKETPGTWPPRVTITVDVRHNYMQFASQEYVTTPQQAKVLE